MIYEMLSECLPDPVCLEIKCEADWYDIQVGGCLTEVRKKHNKKHDDKIRAILIHFVTDDDNLKNLQWNEYCISIGNKEIMRGKGPEDDSDVDKTLAFFESIIPIMEVVLNNWHDEIIEQQNKNDEKIKELEMEGYDEMCYAYYSMLDDKRAFMFLKKLAERYPNTEYSRRLCRVYVNGQYGWHQPNDILAKKLRNRMRRKPSANNF